MRRIVALLLSLTLAVPAFASFGGGGSSPPPTPQPGEDQTANPQEGDAHTARQEAEHAYSDGYNEVAKGKDDLANQKTKNADKHFKKALERGQQAVDLDSTYVEAWNLVGFCARQLKDYDRSLAAYGHCLRLNPGYAPAREYLGEAYVELNQPDKAREQLAALDLAKASDESSRLRSALDVWAEAHPQAAKAAAATPDSLTATTPATTVPAAPAASDSTATAGGK